MNKTATTNTSCIVEFKAWLYISLSVSFRALQCAPYSILTPSKGVNMCMLFVKKMFCSVSTFSYHRRLRYRCYILSTSIVQQKHTAASEYTWIHGYAVYRLVLFIFYASFFCSAATPSWTQTVGEVEGQVALHDWTIQSSISQSWT